MPKMHELLLAGRGQSIRIAGISTSEKELKDIIKAWIAVSLAFAIALGGLSFAGFYRMFIIASLTVGIGFLLHEIGHKIAAQRYGCFAEFRSFDQMLILAIAMSFIGDVFAAPGAVMISGRVNSRKNGVISAAGPAINLVLAAVFLLFSFSTSNGFLNSLAYYGFSINSWLALFNMIPVWLFDGRKIFMWSKAVWGIILSIALLFVFGKGFLGV